MEGSFGHMNCKFCGSPNVVKNGTRNGVQYWLCKNCGRGFVDNKGLPKMRYSIDDVASALYQYYTGLSLNEIRGHIEQYSELRTSPEPVKLILSLSKPKMHLLALERIYKRFVMLCRACHQVPNPFQKVCPSLEYPSNIINSHCFAIRYSTSF